MKLRPKPRQHISSPKKEANVSLIRKLKKYKKLLWSQTKLGEKMRRIITGHNDSGKSVISIDGPPARSIGEEAGGLYEIWNTNGGGFDTTSNEDRADIDIVLSPVQKRYKV
uniref:Uncharacterized protein n=1 Tax=uncultured marine bacterium MedDCM-OCT-S04-C293 TaxID=743054 RepID=D6PCU6_9BACT|nr:hypothetical protein [uncultured marine bacterium MedDCM-OCT-S04-C293]